MDSECMLCVSSSQRWTNQMNEMKFRDAANRDLVATQHTRSATRFKSSRVHPSRQPVASPFLSLTRPMPTQMIRFLGFHRAFDPFEEGPNPLKIIKVEFLNPFFTWHGHLQSLLSGLLLLLLCSLVISSFLTRLSCIFVG